LQKKIEGWYKIAPKMEIGMKARDRRWEREDRTLSSQ